MSSSKKRRELNRAKEEHERSRIKAEFAIGNQTFQDFLRSELTKEYERLKEENNSLKEQLKLLTNCS